MKRLARFALLVSFAGGLLPAARGQSPNPASTAPAVSAAPSLTLAQAVAIAIKNRPRLLAAMRTAQAARKITTEVRSNYFPHVYGNATGAKAENGSRITAGGLNNPVIYSRFADGAIVSQLVTDFGRTHNLVKSAGYGAKSQQEVAQSTRAEVILEVHEAYYEALQAQAVLRVARQDVKARQLVADQVGLLAKNKLKSGLDVSFADVDLSKAKLFLAQAENNVDAAFANLSLALGSADLQEYRLAEEPVPQGPLSGLDSLVTQAYANRPEIAGSRYQLDSARAFTKAERDLWFPTLSAVGSAGLTPYRQDPLLSRYAAMGFNLSIPVFEGGLFKARHEEAEYREQAVEQNLKELQDKVARDVRVAWLNANTAHQRLDLTQQLLQQAGLALSLAQSRYTLGLSSIIELSQAQLNETQAEIDQASAKYQYQIATDVLNYQVGLLR